MDPFTIGVLIVSLLVGIYNYTQMRKMQKKNKPTASQLDGSIVDEGQSFSDIAGSPLMFGFITWIGNKSTEAIKSEGGKK